MRSIKTKLTVLVSLLVILVMGIYASFSFYQEQKEMSVDIFRNAHNFSELVSVRIMDNYYTNYITGNFVNFKTLMIEELEKNEDIQDVVISDYQGVVGYHYQEEKDQQFGEDFIRRVQEIDGDLLRRVQAVYPSIKISGSNERILFIQKEDDQSLGFKEIQFVDETGKLLAREQWLQPGEQVANIVRPMRGKNDDQRHAVVYALSYASLYDRLMSRALQTGILTLIFILGGILVGYIFAGRIVAPIKKLTKGVLHIGEGHLGESISVHTHDEVGVLADSFNQMSEDLKNATDELVVRERLAKEVELAAKIQEEFLPKEIPFVGGLDIAAGVQPADAVGGDCYDFIPLGEDKVLYFIGDVTGHGVSAGLITAIANSIVYSLAEDENVNTKELAVSLNRVLRAKTRPDMFITMFIGLWDATKKTMSFTPAGHEPTYLFRAKTKTLETLPKEGIALGMLDDISAITKNESITLEKGDVLIMYSDGIPEAWSPNKELYEFGRFEESIKKHATKDSAETIYKGIIDDVYDFMGDAEQQDDVTLIVMRLGD